MNDDVGLSSTITLDSLLKTQLFAINSATKVVLTLNSGVSFLSSFIELQTLPKPKPGKAMVGLNEKEDPFFIFLGISLPGREKREAPETNSGGSKINKECPFRQFIMTL